MKFITRTVTWSIVVGGAISASPSLVQSAEANKPSDEQIAFFEKKIRPIFVDNCYVCHSQDHKEAGGLRVDDFKAITKQGKTGTAAVVPGDSEKSVLMKRVTHPDDSKTMPPKHRLSDSQIADLKAWIDDGAAWPPLVLPSNLTQTLEPGVIPHPELKENHWSWQPLAKTEVPSLAEGSPLRDWQRSDVDKFIAKKLEEERLSPVGDANKEQLLRRVTLDLTGLPPTIDELKAFLDDNSPRAFETVVDRLLSSQAFGERWGRHWLDVARYGESTGSARNLPYPHAWRYRDYVIDSFNQDKPYDTFIQEQIAGDLLPANSIAEKRDQLIATGFLALGVKDVNQRFKVRYDMDNVDEQIDTVSRSVLGLTVSCARCHDHKFDPISTRDYYALAGIFSSTELCDALRNQMGGGGLAYYVPDRLISLSGSVSAKADPELQKKIDEKKAELEAAQEALAAVRDGLKEKGNAEKQPKTLQQARQAMRKKQAELVALTDPAKLGPVALGVRESKTVGDTEVRIRGEAEKLGPLVQRGFLTLLDHVPSKQIEEGRSGRYELAKWLTNRSNPLTSRIAVNRIWQHLFGEGIVTTVDNFGSTGDIPSHPELLDYLANKFVEDGWSFKKLIRHLVLTRTYQLASTANESALAADPANRHQWRHAPRRLEAEEIRDAILAVSGKLETTRPEGSPAKDLPVIELRNNGQEASGIQDIANQVRYRSVYLPLLRGIVPTALEVFDFAEQGLVTGKRTNTTVAPQALYLLNDTFVRKYSLLLAESLLANHETNTAEQVKSVYQAVFNRLPNDDESSRAVAFVSEYRATYSTIRAESKDDISKVSADEDAAAKKSEAPIVLVATAVDPSANPDEVKAGEVKPTSQDVKILAKDEVEASIAALVQSLLSSAEFRYVR